MSKPEKPGKTRARSDAIFAILRFIYDGQDVIRDTDGNGVTIADYLNGPGIDNKLRQTTAAAGALYFTSDHLGSTRALTNPAGVAVANLTYDSFGNSSGSSLTRYTYTGREFDADTGLLYYRARTYDPRVGRFVSEDPLSFAGGDFNLFTYVKNSPTNRVDPKGIGFTFRSYLANAGECGTGSWRGSRFL